MLVRRTALVLALGVVLAGCGARPAPGDDLHRPQATGVMNDPALEAAANAVIPELERAFPDTYSGVEMRHADRTMVIYRLPDPKLDEFVRSRTSGITTMFRDAKLSATRMRVLVDQVMLDRDYWHGQGITINGAGPMPDGSGIEVLTPQGSLAEERALTAHYGEGLISVRAATPVPAGTLVAPTAPPLTLPSR
jgi:hypothetical protein